MRFEIVGPITKIEVIAVSSSIRNLAYLRKRYGKGRWRKMKGIAKVRLLDGSMKRRNDFAKQFAVCVDNVGNEASLELGKLYEVIPDEEAVKHGYLRVVDESGEDYWHAAEMFYLIKIPIDLATTLHSLYRAA